MFLRVLMLVCWVTLVPGVQAEQPAAEQVRVFKVFDGDRMLVRSRYHSRRVQLAGIDAPALDQPGGLRSLKILEKMVRGQRVMLHETGVNADGEPLVSLQLHKYDIATEMLRAGAAWATADSGDALRAAEAEARAAGKGIWAADQPAAVPPWEWQTQGP